MTCRTRVVQHRRSTRSSKVPSSPPPLHAPGRHPRRGELAPRRRGPERRSASVAILVGQGARGARPSRAGRRRARRRRREGPARQGRPQRRAAVRHRLDRHPRHPPDLRDDARLRHAADRRVEHAVQPVPAGVRAGERGAVDIDGTRIGMRYPYRGQPRRRRRRDPRGPAAAAVPKGSGPRRGGRRSRTTWWPGGPRWSGRRLLDAKPVNPMRIVLGALAAAAGRTRSSRPTPAPSPTGTPASSRCTATLRGSLSGTLATMGAAVRTRSAPSSPTRTGRRSR